MGSKWIFFIFAYFIFSINQKYTQIYAEEKNSDLEEEKSRELYMDQVSRLRKCSGKRTPEKVVNITVLLPYDVPENGGSDDGIWTKKNNLSRVLPGIALAAENLRNRNDTLLPSQSFSKIHDILPDWKISVKYADTHCDSTFGPLEAVRLRCNTDVFMGPVCPYVLAPVARFSNIWKIPILTTSGMGVDFREKDQYPIISLSGTYDMLC